MDYFSFYSNDIDSVYGSMVTLPNPWLQFFIFNFYVEVFSLVKTSAWEFWGRYGALMWLLFVYDLNTSFLNWKILIYTFICVCSWSFVPIYAVLLFEVESTQLM